MPIGNLGSYRGSYEIIGQGESVSLTFFGEDFKIFFTTTTKTKIKIKVDGLYEEEMIWHTGVIAAASDIFDVSYANSPHSYYDQVDTETAENPSILRLKNLLDYGEHTLIIEVANESGNNLYLEAIAIFDTSVWKNVRDITTELLTDALTLEQEIEEQRNDVIIVGTERGTFNKDGQVINPNNPIYIHTYSRAVDLSSIYNASSANYIGRHLPFEVYNERILNQDRADHIALNALKKYRDPEITASFQIPGDPRIDPFDPIGFNELKLNMLPSGERIWVDSITEHMTENEYLCTIAPLSREPIASFETKSQPDINLFNNEPLINIVLKSQGVRIAGNDATIASTTVTIANSPGWEDNQWNGYIFFDEMGQNFYIEDTLNGNQLTIQLLNKIPEDGNWSISFDPFDTDQKGAPLEIHYDQVINGKVQIWIKDANDVALARINKDIFNEVQEWGEDKVIYWNGSIEFNTKEGREGCYISEASAVYETPLRLVFNVIPEDPEEEAIEVNSNGGGSNAHNGTLTVRGVTSVLSPLGTIRIYPKLLLSTPMIKVTNSGNAKYSEDIHFWGYMLSKIRVGDYWDITLAPSPGFTTNEYQDYLLVDTSIGFVARIFSNTANTVRIKEYDYKRGICNPNKTYNNNIFRILLLIVGQADRPGSYLTNLMHDHFRSTDNDGRGLKLIAETYTPTYTWQTSPNGDGANLLGPHSAKNYEGVYFFAADNLDYLEFNAKPAGQQHPHRSIWNYLSRTWTHPTDLNTTEVKKLVPFTGAILTNQDFRITADLVIYNTNDDGITKKIAEISNYIDSGGYVKLEDFTHFMKPENLVLEGTSEEGIGNTILQHSAALGWYFLFRFTFMDRAGRFSPNTFYGGPSEEEPAIPQPFGYLLGWQPNDITQTSRLQSVLLNYPDAEESEVVKDFREGALIAEMNLWNI